MHDTGLQYTTGSTNFRRGEGNEDDAGDNKKFQEGVYSMYLKLEVDKPITSTNSFIEDRSTATAINVDDEKEGWKEGQVIYTHVTDGNHKQSTTFTVSLTRPAKNSSATEACLVLTYDGKLTGNGVVSFGEIIDMNISHKPKLRDIERCYIGTTYDIGTNLDTELETIIKDSGLGFNETQSNSILTTNIVDSNSTSTVVCLENVTGLDSGDIIYTQDGHLIGEILAISNQTITFATGTKYYTPPQYSNITKSDKKTFVTNLTFTNTDVYTAINSLTRKKGLDYKIVDNTVITRNINDLSSVRRKSIEFKHLVGREPISNNESMFDKINKVIVVGSNGVSYEMGMATNDDEKVWKEVDSTITTEEEAKIAAMKILHLHNSNALKITLTISKKAADGSYDFSLLEAGDLVTLNFPTYNIPAGDYIIYEVSNILGEMLTLKVGSYSKGIAERLTQMNQESKDNINHLLSASSGGNVGGKMIFDKLKLRMDSIEYKVVGEVMNSNIGFDDILGFTEIVGFETTSTGIVAIKKEYKNRFYD